jgi:hypothetical protein
MIRRETNPPITWVSFQAAAVTAKDVAGSFRTRLVLADDQGARPGWVDSGHASFPPIPCASRRFLHLKPVNFAETKEIPRSIYYRRFFDFACRSALCLLRSNSLPRSAKV